MKNILSLTMLLVVAGTASAATINCADQTNGPNGVGGNTLDKYLALGSAGCYIGNVLFSNFAYSYTLGTDSFYVSGPTGTGTQQNADVVVVAVNALNEQFQFGANWIVNHYQTATLSLSFVVQAPPSAPLNTIQNVYTGTEGGTQNGGPTHTSSAVCTGGTCGPTTFTNQTKTISATNGPLTISNTIFMNANGSTIGSSNNYHLSIIEDQFKQTAPPGGGTPEPGTWLLVGAGIGLAGMLKRRRAV